MLDRVAAGFERHGPTHLIIDSARFTGWTWDISLSAGLRPGLLELRILAGSSQHFLDAVRDASESPRMLKIFAKGGGLRVPFLGDIFAFQQLLVSSHVRDRDNGLLRGILSGGFSMGFYTALVPQ